MSFPGYSSLDGLALAELVRKREIATIELVDEAIAGGAPFERVPLLLKDILADCGMPTRSGSRFVPEILAFADSELVTRYKRAGFIPLAKTNVPEFGIVPTTESRLYGPARNPWNLERTTGGSSGGAAAAVAVRIVPIAHGNDGTGSIRIPGDAIPPLPYPPTSLAD